MGFIASPECPYVKKELAIVSNCKVALTQGRYSWRHDSVLNCLEPTLRKYIKIHNEKKEIKRPVKLINFVKAGLKALVPQPLPLPHFLGSANDSSSSRNLLRNVLILFFAPRPASRTDTPSYQQIIANGWRHST